MELQLFCFVSSQKERLVSSGIMDAAAFVAVSILAVAVRYLKRHKKTRRLTSYDFSKDCPPRSIGADGAAVAKWYREVFGAVKMLHHDPSLWTPRESQLLQLSGEEYIQMRRALHVTCEEYVCLLVRRARHYRYMNQWTFRAYSLLEAAIETARKLDRLAREKGIEAIAPLYGMPIPMKGTGAVVQYPSGAGCGVLSGYTPRKDCAMVKLIRKANGIILGTTNVPEFAAALNTINAASGQTRNPFDHALTPGGSSGGAASAVSMHMCPVAITEDTGGSTRVPALCNCLFGFDPARNHYPNEGNPGMTYTNDQIGLVTRTMADMILCDRALMGNRHQADHHHDLAARNASSRTSKIRIGLPQNVFVVGKHFQISPEMRAKYDVVKRQLARSGVTTVENEGWPMSSCVWTSADSLYFSFGGQISQWVYEYLGAPVSLKDIVADMARAGVSQNPSGLLQLDPPPSRGLEESQFREQIGPMLPQRVKAYNAYFDDHDLDFILIPAAYSSTPLLHQTADGSVPLWGPNGEAKVGHSWFALYPHNSLLKELHIPKLAIPTGLGSDGRPTGIQIWGRALPYEHMFSDERSTEHSITFLHLAAKVVRCLHADLELQRQSPGIVRPCGGGDLLGSTRSD